MFTAVGIAVITVVPSGGIEEFLAYLLMLAAAGIFICNADKALVVLYAVLTVEIMQLCYGIGNSALSILYVLPNVYPLMLSFSPHMPGAGFMVSGNMALLAAVFCYRTADRYFLYNETVKRQYVLIILAPVLMMFLVSGYIRSVIYGNTISTDGRGIKTDIDHCQMLMIQLLAMASLFCIMSAYRKLLENFRLSTELSLLEQEEHFLNQYVEEARNRYEKTKSFRHDIRNHITVIKELLQRKETEQAFLYIEDMEGMAEELSFPCSTNNPAADILIGNKLGIAESMGIDVCCSVSLPYPCSIRDIDFCIILSNALDNAIHACKSMDHEDEKYIHVAGRIQGDFILLEIENSFRGSGSFRKGTGLSNIEAVAEKYHGTMDIKIQGSAVVLSVLLIIPQHAESISQQMGECSVSDSRNRWCEGRFLMEYAFRNEKQKEDDHMSMEINGSYSDTFGKTYYKNHYAEGMGEEREKAKETDQREDPRVKPDNSAQPEEKCTGSTDKADREIEKLKEKRKQLEQRIHAASGDERRTAELRRELAQVESELSRKDNDTYRRQHTVFYRV